MCGWLIARTQWYSWVCWDRSINDLLWVKFLFHLHHFSRAWRKNLATNLFLVCFLFPVLSICVNLCTSSSCDQLLYKEDKTNCTMKVHNSSLYIKAFACQQQGSSFTFNASMLWCNCVFVSFSNHRTGWITCNANKVGYKCLYDLNDNVQIHKSVQCY